MVVCLITLPLLIGSAPAPAEQIETILQRGDRSEIVRAVGENRLAWKKYFAVLMERLLTARLANDSGTSAVEEQASTLAEIFAEECKEPHLRAFLREALAWDTEQMRQKRAADQTFLKAQALAQHGQNTKAISSLKELSARCRKIPYAKGLTSSLILQGEILRSAGDLAAALKPLRTALREAERVSYRRHMRYILSKLGWIYLRRGEHTAAEGAYEKYLKLSQEIGDQRGESRARINLAQVALETGRHDNARSHLLKALSLPGRDPSQEGALYHGLGRLYSHERNHLAAFRAFEKALAAAADDALRIKVGINLGGLWWLQGDGARARTAYETALALAKKSGHDADVAAIVNNLGIIYDSEGDLDKARESFQQALDIQRRLGDLAMVGRTLANLCRLDWRQGKEQEGTARFEKALGVLRKVGDRAVLGGLMTVRGHRYLAARQYMQAQRSFREAERLKLAVRDFEGLALAKIGLGRAALAAGNRAEACTFLRDAMENLQRQREQVTSARYRDIFFSRRFLQRDELAEGFTLLAGALIDDEKDNEAFTVSEKAKAQGLLAEYLAGTGTRQHIPADLRQREAELRQRQATLRRKLATSQGAEYDSLAGEFDRTMRAYQSLEEEIWAHLPRSRPEAANRGSHIKQALPPGVLLLEYLLGTKRSFLFAVTRHSLETFILKGESEINPRVEKLLRRCRDPLSPVKASAYEVAQLLIVPAAEHIRSASRLVIVADGVLHGLPFGILRLDGRYLLEACPISYVPSLTFALLPGPAGAAPHKAFVFGDPAYRQREVLDPHLGWGHIELTRLKASRTEAEKVSQLLGAQLFTGTAATEAQLKAVLPRSRFLHLALHGFIHRQRPQLSCLLLSPGAGEDGVLELRELAGAPSELVVLSACESGLGEFARTEGFLGFARAFFIAGVRQLVVSYWSVNDQCSAALMPGFWRAYRTHGSASRALRDAKLAFLSDARAGTITVSDDTRRGPFQRVMKKVSAEHPFFWAGFVALSREIEP